MPPLSTFERAPFFHHHRSSSGSDVSSSHSTFSVNNRNTKKSLAPPSSSPATPSSSIRRVHFAPTARVKATICRSQYTPEEMYNCWFSKAEYKVMKVERKSTIKLMEQGDDGGDLQINDGQSYYRGLETKTREGQRRKQFNVVDASMSVFEEQMQQENDGVNNQERIAQLYIESSKHCLTAAYERGMIDQKAALEAFMPAMQQQQRQPRRLSCQAA